MKPKLNHIWIPIIISTILSLITIVSTYIFDNWGPRYLYNVFFFTFFNFTLILFNTALLTKYPKHINARARKFLRVLFIFTYSAIYLVMTISFIKTGQIIRSQTLLFIYNMNTFIVTAIAATAIAIILILITFIFHNKIKIPELEKQERKILKIALFISATLLVITILINTTQLELTDELFTSPEEIISYQEEKPILDPLFSENPTFDKPNVVFILLEALSAENVGAYGYERNVTPNIDKLAEESIVFTNAYTTSSHSDYAQPGLLSSRYIFSSNYHNVPIDNSPRKFVWDIFKEDNYTTGYYSSQDDKWQNMNQYINYENLDNFSYSRTDGKMDYGFGLAQKDYDHKTADLAIEWLNETKNQSKPFFLYLNFQATHLPRSYPDEFNYYNDDMGIFGNNNNQDKYDNAIRYVDIQVGKILNFLEENNLTNNTIITLTSDHGEDLQGRHGISNHGQTIYNEELIVPAMIHIPGIQQTTIKEKISHIDFVPTLIDLLGYPIPKEFQGKIMRENRPIFFVAQSHKYLLGMIRNNTKIILDLNRDLSEVYNLEEDPQELSKLKSKDYPKDVLKLLFWGHCQREYYSEEKWVDFSPDRCTENNNFKI